jgi:hypothetical protein
VYRALQFYKRSQLFIGTHTKRFSVAAMRLATPSKRTSTMAISNDREVLH